MVSSIHKALFPLLRQLSDGRFHSGETLAQRFGLSRASIFNLIHQAEALGVRVHAVRGRGYQLAVPVEWLEASTVRRHLGTASDAYAVRIVDSVASTNAVLLAEAMAGAESGCVLCAEHQAAGKGRRGRAWHAAPGGGLTFSVLWRFDNGLQSLVGLSLAVGLAIARTINRHSIHPARLKWPNDVLVGYRKLAGILVEVQGDLHGAALAVIGVGLNVRLSPAQREEIDQAVVDLHEMGVTIGRNQLLAECLVELQRVVETFCQHGFVALREDWMALDAYADKPVQLRRADASAVCGVAKGVDASGALLLQDPARKMHAHSGGELSLRLARGRP